MQPQRSIARSTELTLALLLAAVVGCTPLRASQSSPKNNSAIKTLDDAFVDAYNAAAKAHLAEMREEGPIILNDFLDMTLYRMDGSTTTFQMDAANYLLMARTAHPALALFSLVREGGLGPLSASERTAVREYVAKLSSAYAEILGGGGDQVVTKRALTLIQKSQEVAESALVSGTFSEDAFRSYASEVRPLIEANLELGAREQLEQFRAALDSWRSTFPNERWDRLRVVVLGFHQARELYATKLLFRWLLREPVLERRVVYAEVLIPPFGAQRDESHRLALELLSKVDLDREAADLILGDSTALQRDVMGPATEKILESWGASSWP